MFEKLVQRIFSPRTKARRAHGFQPRIDKLEDRTTPTATMWVNDNWVVTNDVDASGDLSNGDIVASTGTDFAVKNLVFGSAAFDTIQAAVDASAEGDKIEVLAGNYTEDVSVDKTLTIEGANAGIEATAIRGPETVLDGGFRLFADQVTIDGFTIEGGVGPEGTGDVTAIYMAAGTSGHTIANNILAGDGTGRGILTTFNGNNNDLIIEGNEIYGWTTGIFNQSNSDVEISDNFIHDNFSGVANDFTTNVRIENNLFKGNDEAIGTFESDNLVVVGNNLADNTVGIANYGGEAVVADGNWWGSASGPSDTQTTGDVTVGTWLTSPPTLTTVISFSLGDNLLQVDTATGQFKLTLADGTVYSGTGARVQKGVLKIHEQTPAGKIDVMGSVDGDVSVDLRGKAKKSLKLTSNSDD